MPNSPFSNRAFNLYALFSQYSSCNIHKNCFLQFSPQSRAFTGMVFEQEAHLVDDIRHYLWLKSWFLCQVDKLRDIILIFLFTNFESKRLIQEMLYFVPTFFWVLQHTDWLIFHVIEGPLNSSFVKRVLSALATREGGAEVTALAHPPKWSLEWMLLSDQNGTIVYF